MLHTLTERQQELYDFIVTSTADNGIQPSYAEMAQHMWVSSPNAIRDMVAILERKGYVQRTGKVRAMKIFLLGIVAAFFHAAIHNLGIA